MPFFYPLDGNGAPRLDWIRQQNLQGVRAILVAHFFGLPQPLAAIRQWCDQRGIRLIEDCAHALFGRSDGKAIGSWGDVAIGSLTKFHPVPEGGCWGRHLHLGYHQKCLRVAPLHSELADFLAQPNPV